MSEHIAENNFPVFYDTAQLAAVLGVSVPTARGIMRRADFPTLKFGRTVRVSREALLKWAEERREVLI